jgi:SAM-dependent methyltransferase
MALSPVSSYEAIAAEYYSGFHPTSRNFEAATRAGVKVASHYVPKTGLVLDAGAGKGRAGEYLGVPANRILQLDSSKTMLSVVPREASAARIRADALQLPFRGSTLSMIAAFLFDPYNQPRFFEEAHRTLKPGGVFLATLPHVTWGESLRRLRGYPRDRARFVTATGRKVEVGSTLLGEQKLRVLLEENRLLPEYFADLRLPVGTEAISADILDPAIYLHQTPKDLPIVQLMVALKR